MSCFGKEFRKLISLFHLKYSTVAGATQYDASYVSKWINSDIMPSARSIPQICSSIANLIITSSSQEQMDEFCAQNGLPAGADVETIKEHIIKLLTDAFRQDESMRQYPGKDKTATPGDRAQVLRLNLQQLSEQSSELNLTVLGDLATIRVEDIIFLMDLLNEANELPFQSGSINLLVSTESIEQSEDARLMVSLMNLMMITSKLHLQVNHCPTRQTGLIIATDTLLYQAQCRTDTGWLLESYTFEAEEVRRRLLAIQSTILPTSRSIYTRHPLSAPVSEGDNAANVFWNNREKQIIGMFDTLYCEEAQQKRLLRNQPELAAACLRQHKLLLRMLDGGLEHQCVVYREALDSLAYQGSVCIAGREVQLSATERFAFLQGLARLLDEYHNLKIRVIDGFVVDEIKHHPLPNIFLSRGTAAFLSFPKNGERDYCLVQSAKFRKAMDRMFNHLWEQNGVKHFDVREILDEYFDFCQDLLLNGEL